MDRFDKTIYEILKRKHPEADDAEMGQWMHPTDVWARKNITSMQKWVIQTQLMMKKKLDDVHVDLFFIRLYGIIVDIPNYVTPNLKVFRDEQKNKKISLKEVITKNITNNAKMRQFLFGLVDVEDALNEIRSAFSAEDIFAITYFRHAHCHPVLKDYKVKLKVKGKTLTFDAKKYEKFLEHESINELDLCERTFNILQSMSDRLEILEQSLRRL